MANPPNTDALKQISEAWEQAKSQLTTLRDQVEKAGELANLKLQSAVLERDEDKAFRDFGQAVWAQVQKGGLKLPSSLSTAMKAMQEIQKKRDAQTREINDLLEEGRDIADRMKKAPTKHKPAGKSARR